MIMFSLSLSLGSSPPPFSLSPLPSLPPSPSSLLHSLE